MPDVAGVAVNEPAQRPEPGLARGRWEAPSWVFFAVAAVALAAGLAWAARAMLQRRRRKSR